MIHYRVDLKTGNIIDRNEDYTEAWAEEVRETALKMAGGDEEKAPDFYKEIMTQFVTLNYCGSSFIAQRIAEQLSEETGDTYIAVERHDDYAVERMPKIGDVVSYGFNGDWYPCGTIEKISKTMKKVTTSDGGVFWRQGNTATYKRAGTWTLARGVHNDRNPHF